MTEAEWLEGKYPGRMLASLTARNRGQVPRQPESDERLRLFAIACCRRVTRVLASCDRDALDCLELFARSGSREALVKARRFRRVANESLTTALTSVDRTDRAAWFLWQARSLATNAVGGCTKPKSTQAAMSYVQAAQSVESIRIADDPTAIPTEGHWQPPSRTELAVQCELLRDIFGNPFRPVAFSPEWRSDTAVSLAKHIYDSRDFSTMPILADALQDAGCDNAEILNHCREANSVHVRGCWVVDGVLGKS